MRRSLFLESENATKVDNVYTFDFKRPHDSYVNGFEIRNCVVNYSPTKTEVVTRAQINALSLCAFFDYTDSTKITESGGYVTPLPAGANLADVVDALNMLGASPADLVAILEALKQAGSLTAEVVVI